MTPPKVCAHLCAPLKVINVGLETFAADLAANGAQVQDVQWVPPARGDAALARLLLRLGA